MNSDHNSAEHPLRLLDRIMPDGLGIGELGVIMARAGVGKTAFLVHIGLDAMLRGRKVVHVAIGQSTDHVHAWYDALLTAIIAATGAADVEERRAHMTANRVIQTYPADTPCTPQRLEQAVGLFCTHMGFQPDLILIDGFDWEMLSPMQTAAAIGAFKACAHRHRAQLWMSAQTHHTLAGDRPAVLPPCAAYAELIDGAVFLEPQGDRVMIRMLKDRDRDVVGDTHLLIECDTFCVTTDQGLPRLTLHPAGHTLLSGGAPGAEAAFGECAERWGLQEINFSFEGHQTARTRGLVKLSCSELAQGHVSDVYIKAKMHRTYPATPLFKKILQSIWHQVNTAGEVFVVGTILPDATVRGGTGWAAELAKHWKKPLWVFDQEQQRWFAWRDGAWTEIQAPCITRSRFTGTGTRFLNEHGKSAVLDLFERSFGPAPRR